MKQLFKILFLVTIIFGSFVPFAVSAQQLEPNDRITKTQANQFYAECMDTSYPSKSEESKELFCSCSAANFYEQLRQRDVTNLQFDDTWQARLTKEKMLMYVYTPCIEDALNDLLTEECYTSTYLDDYPHISKNKFCQCQLQRMEIVYEKSRGRIAEENKSDLEASLSDPITSFMENSYYQSQSDKITTLCMQNAVIKIEKSEPITSAAAPLVVRTDIGRGHTHDYDTDSGHGSGRGGSSTGTSGTTTGNGVNPRPIRIASNNNGNAEEPAKEKASFPKSTKKVCTQRLPYEEAYKPENVRTDLDNDDSDNNAN